MLIYRQAALAERLVLSASLLAGRMTENIGDAFAVVGLSLFPSRKSDLETDCSCPDFVNPCKRIAAVYLLLGEEFDRGPFLIFRMRGIERDELLGPDLCDSVEASAWMSLTLAPDPLPADHDAFWGQPEGEDNYDDLIGPAGVPEETAALPKQLGGFPFWQGSEGVTADAGGPLRTGSAGRIGTVPGRGPGRTISRRRPG